MSNLKKYTGNSFIRGPVFDIFTIIYLITRVKNSFSAEVKIDYYLNSARKFRNEHSNNKKSGSNPIES